MLRIFPRSKGNGEAPEGAGFAVSAEVTASIHPEGIVFLHSAKGAVFSSNMVGARIWEGIREGKSPDGIAAALGQEFQVSPRIARLDAARFVLDLEAEGMGRAGSCWHAAIN
jgi:hypothetical protein